MKMIMALFISLVSLSAFAIPADITQKPCYTQSRNALSRHYNDSKTSIARAKTIAFYDGKNLAHQTVVQYGYDVTYRNGSKIYVQVTLLKKTCQMIVAGSGSSKKEYDEEQDMALQEGAQEFGQP